MTIKYCVNCENQITPSQTFIADTQCDDFCSQECADEYLSNADERVLLLARESNPDALPLSETAIKSPRLNTGHSNSQSGILPGTLEAVQSLLQIGGVSKEDIDKVVSIDKANNKELTQKEQEFVKNEPQD